MGNDTNATREVRTDKETIFPYQSVTITDKTTVSAVAKSYNVDPKLLMYYNTQFLTLDDPVAFSMVSIPVEQKLEDTLTSVTILDDRARPIVLRIRPYISEIFRLIFEFDTQSAEFYQKIQKKNPEIITHHTIWKNYPDKAFLSQPYADAYMAERGKILEEYTTAIMTLGYFARSMVYLFHFCFHRKLFWIKQPDKVTDMLQFAYQMMPLLVERTKHWLFYVNNSYQMLDGSFRDVMIYKNITGMINGTFGEVMPAFSKREPLNLFTKYPESFFVKAQKDVDRLNVLGALDDENDPTELDIFDSSFDFSANKTSAYAASVRTKAKTNVENVVKDWFASYEKNTAMIRDLFLCHLTTSSDEMGKYLHSTVENVMKKFPKAKKLNIDSVILAMLLTYDQEVNKAASMFKGKSGHDDEILKTAARIATIRYSIQFSIAFYTIAGTVTDEIGWFRGMFTDEEWVYKDIAGIIKRLLSVAQEADVSIASRELQKIAYNIDLYRVRAEYILLEGKIADFTAEMVILAAAMIVTSGATGIVAGSLESAAITGLSAKIAIFSTEVIAFTFAHEALSSIVFSRKMFDGSIGNAGISLCTNALMFGAFKIAGGIISKVVSRHFVSKGLTLLLVKYTANTLTAVVVGSPFFAVNLMLGGKNLFSREEWLEFLAAQAIMAGMFTVLEPVTTRVSKLSKSVTLNSFNKTPASVSNKIMLDWNTVLGTAKAAQIQQQAAEIKLALDNLKLNHQLERRLTKEIWNEWNKELNTVVDKYSVLLDELISLKANLRRFETSLPEGTEIIIDPEGEIRVGCEIMGELKARIARAVYVPDPRAQMAVEINKVINNQELNGLRSIEGSTEFYTANTTQLMAQIAQIKNIKINGSQIKSLEAHPADGAAGSSVETFNEGKVILQVEVPLEGGGSATAEITIFSKNGDRTVVTKKHADPPAKEAPPPKKADPAKPEDTIDHSKVKWLDRDRTFARPLEELITIWKKFHSLPISDAMDIIKDPSAHPEYVLSEQERIALNKLHIKPRFLARVQNNKYNPEGRQFVYSGDAADYVGLQTVEAMKTDIGYEAKDIEFSYDKDTKDLTDGFWIWEAQASELVEPTYINLRKAFEDYVKLAKSGKVMKRDRTNVNLKNFLDQYKKYGLDKIQDRQWDDIWAKYEKITPSWNKLTDLPRKIPDPNDILELEEIHNPLFALGDLLGTYFSCFPVFTGNGMTLTYTNKLGVREWFFNRNPDLVIQSEMEKPPYNLIKTKYLTDIVK